ncbi:MAG TPA: hypothetical protein VGX23_10530 [Actinocrinis sp.]|nr:hypothetical protein [Actinocrinis sp.]
MDETTAEDWFTADFLEYADSMAAQPGLDLSGREPGRWRAESGPPPVGRYDLRVPTAAVTPGP